VNLFLNLRSLFSHSVCLILALSSIRDLESLSSTISWILMFTKAITLGFESTVWIWSENYCFQEDSWEYQSNQIDPGEAYLTHAIYFIALHFQYAHSWLDHGYNKRYQHSYWSDKWINWTRKTSTVKIIENTSHGKATSNGQFKKFAGKSGRAAASQRLCFFFEIAKFDPNNVSRSLLDMSLFW